MIDSGKSDWVESTDLMSARSIEEFEERNEDYGGCTRMLKLQYPSSAFDIRADNMDCVTTCHSNLLEADSGIEKYESLVENHVDPNVKDGGIEDESTTSKQKLQWSGNSTINAEMQQQGYNVKKKMESQEG
ncbi:hypothetical protein Tco_1198831 [Tanacetum coccineum]